MITRGMRRIILLTLLVAATTAVCVVPHWRNADALPRGFIPPTALTLRVSSAPDQRTADHLRVLFIGNSLSKWNCGQPYLLEELAADAGVARTPICDGVLADGETLYGHLHRTNALARIREGNWDYVVLQEHSTGWWHDKSVMFDAIRTFNKEIRAVGAKPLLFMVWTLKNYPADTQRIAGVYKTISRELGIEVVPVGSAWAMAQETPNAVDTYYSDLRHPAEAGSYLTACVFYSWFYGQSAHGLAHKLSSEGWRLDLKDKDAEFLQDIASRAVAVVRPLGQDGAQLSLDLSPGVKLEMIRIEPGKFVMGSPATEDGHDDSEGPLHEVTIPRALYVGKYEVTQDQFVAVMDRNQSEFRDEGTLPEEGVSWDDCQEFCRILSRRTGRHVRLPTEAEWEYACRAGTSTAFNTGAGISSTQANFDGTQPAGGAAEGPNCGKTKPVGSFAPNAFGLYDMHGNVAEWCLDRFHEDYKGAPGNGSAWMAGKSPNYVYRGGAWNNAANSCRSAVRACADGKTLRNNTIGFRVVIDTP